MVSYYVPPLGGPGIQRVLKFAKYLPRFGWEAVILGVKPIAYHFYDESLEKELRWIKIVKTESLDPTRILARIFGKSQEVVRKAHKGRLDRLSRWFIPIDSRLPWVPFAVKEGKKLISKYSFNVIVSSSPPLSTHLVGLKLHRFSQIPWIADFRDAFLDFIPPPTALHRKMSETLLEKVKREASLITVVTGIIKKTLKLPNAVVIENGFDPEDLEVEAKERDPRFVISYAGGLVDREYALFPLLDALKELEGIVLKIAGYGTPQAVSAMKDPKLRGRVEYLGQLSHREAIGLMKSSDVLWLTVNKNVQKEMVPLKFFEYVGVGKPILATVPEDSEIASYINKYRLGVVTPPDKEMIKEAINALRTKPIPPVLEAREYFNKINQTKRFAEILEALAR